MAKDEKHKLPLYIYSATQIQFFVHQLQHYHSLLVQNKLRSEYKLSSGKTLKLDDELFPDVKKFLLEMAEHKDDIEGSDVEELINFFTEIKDNAPRFNLVTANILNEEAKEEIVEWFRNNIHEFSLVSFDFQKNIAGGFILRSRSSIYDFSIKDKLMNPRTKIRDIL